MVMLKHTLKLFTILLIPMMLFAGETGKIAGSVTDKSNGNLLPGVNVILDGTNMGAATDSNGDFYILNVPPGIYSVKFSFIGYAKVTIENVRVAKDLTTNLYTIELSSEAIAGKEIIVVAEKPLIEINATNEVRIVRGEDIRNMPIRGYENVAAIQTGVVVDASGNMHVRGGRSDGVGFYVDGVLVNNSYTLSRSGSVPNLSLEEVSYQAGGFGAEYGSATAGIVSTTTKTGGSRLEASAETITDALISAGATGPDEPQPFAYSYGYNLISASLGGPVTNMLRLYGAVEMSSMDDAYPTTGQFPKYTGKINTANGLPDNGELFVDSNGNTIYDEGEDFTDADGNGVYDGPDYLAIDANDLQLWDGPKPNNGVDRMSYIGNVLLDLQPVTGLKWKLRMGINGYSSDRTHYSHSRAMFDYYNTASTDQKVGSSGGLRLRFNQSHNRYNSFHTRLSGAVPGVDKMFFNLQYSNSTESYELHDPVFKKGFGKYVYEDGTVSNETIPYIQFGKKEDYASPVWVYEDSNGVRSTTSYWLDNEDLSFVQVNYDTTWINPLYTSVGIAPSPHVEIVQYSLAGSASTSYEKRNTSRQMINGSLVWQYGHHELKFGGEYADNTVRYYRMGRASSLSRYFNNNPAYSPTQDIYRWDAAFNDSAGALIRDYAGDGIADYLQDQTDIWDGDGDYADYFDTYKTSAYVSAYAENIGYNVTGEKEVNKGTDKARKPIIGALYIQDKFEIKDLILNLGLRYDYINPATEVFNPLTGGNTNIVIASDGTIAGMVYQDEDGKYTSPDPTEYDSNGLSHQVLANPTKQISPRIGLAFPVTDKTVFHAQYGWYLQQPEFNRLYLSYARFTSNLQQGNFTISANPELKPVRSVQYEIGVKQYLTNDVTLDATLFYKQESDYIQIRNIAAVPTGYALYVNGDYGTSKGLSLSFKTRRLGNIQVDANYTLSWAGGTGSNSSGLYRIAWQGGNNPSFISPLDYDQRHTGNISVDYRTGARTQIPFMNNLGANMLFRFGSGMPYTPTKPYTAIFGAISSHPIGGLNSANMPWTYNMDLKLDKTFRVAGVDVGAFIWITNVLNTQNIVDVYSASGMPNNDSWLTEPSGENWLNNVAIGGAGSGEQLYNGKLANPYNFSIPRQIRFGIRVDL